jgi:ribonuclease P/MRP protein subunit RPP40
MALLEWLHLISLGSPRIKASDNVDPFLSRYEVPDLGCGLETMDMVRVRWRGFIPPQFVREIFLAVRNEGLKIGKDNHDGEGGTTDRNDERWFALTAKGFDEEGYTIMQLAGRDTLAWEAL